MHPSRCWHCTIPFRVFISLTEFNLAFPLQLVEGIWFCCLYCSQLTTKKKRVSSAIILNRDFLWSSTTLWQIKQPAIPGRDPNRLGFPHSPALQGLQSNCLYSCLDKHLLCEVSGPLAAFPFCSTPFHGSDQRVQCDEPIAWRRSVCVCEWSGQRRVGCYSNKSRFDARHVKDPDKEPVDCHLLSGLLFLRLSYRDEPPWSALSCLEEDPNIMQRITKEQKKLKWEVVRMIATNINTSNHTVP